MDEGGNALEETDREADLLEQVPLPGHPEAEKERLTSWLRLPRRARVAIGRLHRNLRHRPKEALVQMLCCPSSTRLYQCRQDFSMLGVRQREAETANTQSVTTTT